MCWQKTSQRVHNQQFSPNFNQFGVDTSVERYQQKKWIALDSSDKQKIRSQHFVQMALVASQKMLISCMKNKYLEFLIKQKQIWIDPAKFQLIRKWKTTMNMKKIQLFLDFANYNKKFIKDFFKKTTSFTNLTNKDKSW